MGANSQLLPQTWVEIDLGAVRRNFERFASRFQSGVGFILSIKKDAYGHGAIEVARTLAAESRLVALGVATVAEALTLRRAGIATPILCFSILRGADLEAAVANDIWLTITDANDAGEADRVAQELGRKATGHLKIDTGMGRAGRFPHEIIGSLRAIASLENLKMEAVYTHLADGWGDPESARIQKRLFDDFVSECEKTGLKALSQHIGGSDIISVSPELTSGSVRAGIAVYGYHPGIGDLAPVMTFKSRVIYRRCAPAGTKISYGGTHTLQRESELAIVGAGYGNGYPRILSNRGSVLIREKRCPVLGRVSMDQIVVDVTDAPGVEVGDEAVLFGRQGETRLSAEEVAKLAETISYELLCLAGQINPRIYR